jgi:hypothetical protein
MTPRTALLTTILSAAAFAAAGCHSRHELAEEDFRAPVDAYLAREPKCIGEVGITFPESIPSSPDPYSGSPELVAMLRRLNALVRLGLLKSDAVRKGTATEETRYELTPAGSAVYRVFPPGRWDAAKPVGAFCYGTAKVDRVVRFTMPAEGLGEVTSEVTYTYRLRDVAGWAEDPELRKLYPYLERELASRTTPQEATVTVVQASDGWRVVALP